MSDFSMFWGLILEPGKKKTHVVENTFHMSMASVDPKSASGVTSVYLMHPDHGKIILCNLSNPSTLSLNLDLDFSAGEELVFEASGKATVHLTGYVLGEEEDSEYEEEEEAEGLDETKSDDTAKTIETKKRKKVVKDDGEKERKLAVEQAKKVQKAVAATMKKVSEEDKLSMDIDYDSDDEEEDSDFEIIESSGEGEEEESDDKDDDEDEAGEEDSGSSNTDDEDSSEDEEEKQLKEKEVKYKQLAEKKKKDAKKDSTLELSATPKGDKKDKQHATPKATPKGDKAKTPVANGTPKKDKSKTPLGNVTPKGEKTNTPTANGTPTGKTRTLKGGMSMQEIRVGKGKPAKPGQLLGMYYEGRLKQNNKKFDSCLKGKPFRFRLGAGEVIKGWDVGLEGIQQGGKRRLVVPAALAYGAKGSPPDIPSNSTLVFDVECRFIQ